MLPLLFVIVTNGDAEWDDDAEDGGDVGGIEEERVVAVEAVAEAVIGGGEGERFSNAVELDRQLWSRSKVPA